MSTKEELRYIADCLIPELLQDFERYAKEYQQPRDLGIRGEFVGLYRKVRKLKTIFWDGVDASGWREDERTILKEVISHGLLMLLDYDDTRKGSKWQPMSSKAEQARVVEMQAGPDEEPDDEDEDPPPRERTRIRRSPRPVQGVLIVGDNV